MSAMPGVGFGDSGLPASGSITPDMLAPGAIQGQILVASPTNVFTLSPLPATAPVTYPTYMLAGNPSIPTAPVLIVQGASGGTGNVFEVRLANGTIAAYIDAAGIANGFAAAGTGWRTTRCRTG